MGRRTTSTSRVWSTAGPVRSRTGHRRTRPLTTHKSIDVSPQATSVSVGSPPDRAIGIGSCFGAQDCCRERSEVELTPETRYAQTADGGQVAYQVAGGSGQILLLGYTAMPGIDMMWGETRFVRFLHRLSSVSRHVWFDARG